ncbi:MAG: hypothetical protein KDD78_21015, partial [Caldilineaceae bacterium]|nr:hypothetical protein [Caldilineaceae bacterium]
MHTNDTPQFFHVLLELGRNMLYNAGLSGGHNGLQGEDLESESQILQSTVAICCRDEALNRRLLSALRDQPPLAKRTTPVRAEGLFTLVTPAAAPEEDDDAAGPDDAAPDEAATDEHWSRFGPEPYPDAPWPDHDPVHDALDAATCGLFLLPVGPAWKSTDIHLFSRLRRAGTPLMIVFCPEEDDLFDQTLSDYVFEQTGVRPLWVQLPTLNRFDPSPATARGLEHIVDWLAACDQGLAIQLAQELPRFRRRLGAVRIRDAALMAGFLGAEPAPLIDIPLLLLVQRRLAHQ